MRDLTCRGGAQWAASGHTRFEGKFEGVLVQSGANMRRVTVPNFQALTTTELFLKKATGANFRVVHDAAGAN